jgi:branched-chain amino acid transport system substrate-binding protein
MALRDHGAGLKAAALVSIAALGIAACGSSSSKSNAPGTSSSGGGSGKTVKLGFFGALTGQNAQLGINIRNGEQLAISQYDATNPSTKVTIDEFDSQGDPAQANNGATKLISDHVIAVIGPAFSGESGVADPIFEQAGIPNVSASATKTTLAQNGWKFFHRVVADDSAQGPADADYLVKTLGLKKIAVIDDSSSYGQGLADQVRSQVATAGGTVVLSDHVDPNAADYGATVNKVVTANADAVFYGGYYSGAGRLVNQLRAKAYAGKFMSGDGSEDAKFITDAGGAPAEGAFLSCACADTSNNSNAQSFNAAYRAQFGTAPAIYSAEAYDATNAVLQALKSGSTTPAAINSYLATINYQAITKAIKFQSDGNVVGNTIYVYKVQNGQITQIGTTS